MLNCTDRKRVNKILINTKLGHFEKTGHLQNIIGDFGAGTIGHIVSSDFLTGSKVSASAVTPSGTSAWPLLPHSPGSCNIVAPDACTTASGYWPFPAKKSEEKILSYLTVEGIKLLLRQPDRTTIRGIRDFTLIALMYESAASVREIVDLTPFSLRIDSAPHCIVLHGKGNKIVTECKASFYRT